MANRHKAFREAKFKAAVEYLEKHVAAAKACVEAFVKANPEWRGYASGPKEYQSIAIDVVLELSVEGVIRRRPRLRNVVLAKLVEDDLVEVARGLEGLNSIDANLMLRKSHQSERKVSYELRPKNWNAFERAARETLAASA